MMNKKIVANIAFGLLMFLLFSCKPGKSPKPGSIDSSDNNGQSTKIEIVITITGDDGINIKDGGKVTIKKGSTWQTHVKPEVLKKIDCKNGRAYKAFHLNDINGEVIAETHAFNENSTVFVETEEDKWVKVDFFELDDYLKNNAKENEISYIHVTELTDDSIAGGFAASPLGMVVKKYDTKRIAVKFDESIVGAKSMERTFKDCKNLVHVENIPYGINNMASCFQGCTNLVYVPCLPDGLVNMKFCFNGCKNLENIPKIPSTVQDMTSCFLACEKLKTPPVLPQNITSLDSAFMRTGILEMPEIPAKVTNMEFAFYGCSSLTKTTKIPLVVKKLKQTFYGCKEITDIQLECPYNNSKPGDFSGAFEGCSGLKANSIKVKNPYLTDYQNGADNMKISSDRFVGE